MLKNREVADVLREQLDSLSTKHKALTQNFEKESTSFEKKMKSKERQIQELKKELQKAIEISEISKNISEEKQQPQLPPTQNGVIADAEREDGAPLDANYLKHIVLRFSTFLM